MGLDLKLLATVLVYPLPRTCHFLALSRGDFFLLLALLPITSKFLFGTSNQKNESIATQKNNYKVCKKQIEQELLCRVSCPHGQGRSLSASKQDVVDG